MIDFRSATPEALLDRLGSLLDRLAAVPAEKHQTQATVIADVLFAVTGLKVLQLSDPTAGWAADLGRVWAAVGKALSCSPGGLAYYAAGMELSFWEGNREAWFDGCLRRSALEILCSSVEPNSDLLLDHRWLAEIDAELSQIASRIMPLPEESIPAGLPHNHWWWQLPSGTADDEIDYY